MTPDFSDRLNVRLWVVLVILGAVLSVIAWYRYFTPFS
jgi:hypothetical protein